MGGKTTKKTKNEFAQKRNWVTQKTITAEKPEPTHNGNILENLQQKIQAKGNYEGKD